MRGQRVTCRSGAGAGDSTRAAIMPVARPQQTQPRPPLGTGATRLDWRALLRHSDCNADRATHTVEGLPTRRVLSLSLCLLAIVPQACQRDLAVGPAGSAAAGAAPSGTPTRLSRSEERRVGKERSS